MKKHLSLLLVIPLLVSLSTCGGANSSGAPQEPGMTQEVKTEESLPSIELEIEEITTEETQGPEEAAGSKILIAYFTREGNSHTEGASDVDALSSASIVVGNTRLVAEEIQRVTGGDLFPITTVELYPADYRETTEVATEELNVNARPALASHVDNMEDYDIVFLGYPIWWNTALAAVSTFLEDVDLSGKTVTPFTTHEGSGLADAASVISTAQPDAVILDGLAVHGSDAASAGPTVESWLEGLGIDFTQYAAAGTSSGGATDIAITSGTTDISITVDGTVITATLEDSGTTRDFLAMLPMTISMRRYYDQEYAGRLETPLSEDGEQIDDFSNGDVTFYPAGTSLVIFFGNEENSSQPGLIRIGRLISDLSDIGQLGESIEMHIDTVQ